MSKRFLYLVTCGAPLATRVEDGVREAIARDWSPVVIPTDASRSWLEGQDLHGAPLLTEHRQPGEAKRTPPPDAVAVVPATFNTINAWANGNAHTYALTTICAALGARLPTVAVPFAKHDLAGHPAWLASLAVLRYAGVQIVDPHTGERGYVRPVTSGTGSDVASAFRWSWVLDALDVRRDRPTA